MEKIYFALLKLNKQLHLKKSPLLSKILIKYLKNRMLPMVLHAVVLAFEIKNQKMRASWTINSCWKRLR